VDTANALSAKTDVILVTFEPARLSAESAGKTLGDRVAEFSELGALPCAVGPMALANTVCPVNAEIKERFVFLVIFAEPVSGGFFNLLFRATAPAKQAVNTVVPGAPATPARVWPFSSRVLAGKTGDDSGALGRAEPDGANDGTTMVSAQRCVFQRLGISEAHGVPQRWR